MFSRLRGVRFTMRMQCLDTKFFTSTSLVPMQLPSRMETHLWYVKPNEVKSEQLLNKYLEFLPKSEKEHVFSMRGDELRKGALLARALVRTTIARYQINQVSPRSMKFRKNIHGKPEVWVPYVVDWQQIEDWHPQQLHFNISHTESLVACGVTTHNPIGIDIEEKERKIKHSISSFAKRYFSQQEVQLLSSISDPEIQRQEFIKLWTLKEAYVKALGRGFSGSPFKTFTIRSAAASKESIHLSESSSFENSDIVVESLEDSTNHTGDWQFALLELAGSHYAAICSRKDCANIDKSHPMKIGVWRTIPLVEDEYVSGTNSVIAVGGLM
nr:PREDICTED: 4'-phosphopantetheinyl transferase gsp-like isoform X1 [Daucus carota subsp. sativus]XP_017244010.1 PREDICTED: 4'-phosphopantetheinyl transferase gsp-like isoform X1 [Daucus carota subsp. sativus]XP_017244011.1 PREDICTED: 4'-phosphopantetheinyl transferase gsp-like isoform X1 [Daucus carota subsp. sativus]